jgi:hypothetical protein
VGTKLTHVEATQETCVARRVGEVERICDMRREWDRHGKR